MKYYHLKLLVIGATLLVWGRLAVGAWQSLFPQGPLLAPQHSSLLDAPSRNL
ncbi:MAG: hypothetical protein VKK07_00185 [Merismopediaceae bacterium]|nr:hypothetical protein [Merismopediaceae bacterium]